jgi:hypothetical protein
MFRKFSTFVKQPLGIKFEPHAESFKVQRILKNLKVSKFLKTNSTILNFDKIFDHFQESVLKETIYQELSQKILRFKIDDTQNIEQFILPHFNTFAENNYPQEIAKYKETKKLFQISNPYLSYPMARKLKRKFSFYFFF